MNTKNVWSIEISAPREKVWQTLIAPGKVQRFYFDSRFEADLRPGGQFKYTTPNGRHSFIRGEIIEVSQGRRFVHQFRFTDLDEPAQQVSFEFEDVPGGTRLTIRHQGLENAPRHRARVTPGWTGILSNLKSWMEKGRLPWRTRLQYCVMKFFWLTLPKESVTPSP